jgi:hypothetical protein
MARNRLLLLLVVVVGLLLAHGLGDEDLTASLFLSSKTPYWPQQIGGREPMDERCKLVHVNHLGAFPPLPHRDSLCLPAPRAPPLAFFAPLRPRSRIRF